MLVRGEADVQIDVLAYTAGRWAVIDYVPRPIKWYHLGSMLVKSHQIRLSPGQFFLAFEPESWFLILAISISIFALELFYASKIHLIHRQSIMTKFWSILLLQSEYLKPKHLLWSP